MKVFGIQIGKNPDEQGEQSANKPQQNLIQSLKHRLQKFSRQVVRYQISIIVLAVAGLLAVTTLRMLHYMNPPANDTLVQQNIAKYQKTRIDPKIVQKIQALQTGGSTPAPNIQNGRTNPFSE